MGSDLVFDESNLWWVGVILSVFGALFGSLGDNLVKLSYTKEELALEAGKEPTHLVCRPLWWVGMICITIINTTLTLVAYTFADASICIPFAGLHIVFNVGFARVINGEQFTSRQVGFTFIILVGVTIVLVSGNHDTRFYTVEELQVLFTKIPAISMSVLIAFLLIVEIIVPIVHYSPQIRCLFSALLVGTVGSVVQVFAKTMSTCFDLSIRNGPDEVFGQGLAIAYVSIVVTACAALAQLTLLNRLLSRYNAFVVVPIVNSALIVLGSLYGSIVFEEYKRYDVKSEVLMPLGILTTGCGVSLLAWDHHPEATKELLLGSPSMGDISLQALPRSHSFAAQRSPFRDSFFDDHPESYRQSFDMPRSQSYINYRDDLGAQPDLLNPLKPSPSDSGLEGGPAPSPTSLQQQQNLTDWEESDGEETLTLQ